MHIYHCKTTVITKNRGNMIPPKEHNKILVTDPKEMEIMNCPDKVIKILVLKKPRELKKHR